MSGNTWVLNDPHDSLFALATLSRSKTRDEVVTSLGNQMNFIESARTLIFCITCRSIYIYTIIYSAK